MRASCPRYWQTRSHAHGTYIVLPPPTRVYKARRRNRRKLRGRSDEKHSKRPLVSAGGVGPCGGGRVQSARARCLRWAFRCFRFFSRWGCFLCLLVSFAFSLPSAVVAVSARWLLSVAGCLRCCRRARVVSALRRGVSFRLCGCRPFLFVGLRVSAACACCRVCCLVRPCCVRALRGGCCRCRLAFVRLRCPRCPLGCCLPVLFASLGFVGLPRVFAGCAVESAVCARGRVFAASGVFANRPKSNRDAMQPSEKIRKKLPRGLNPKCMSNRNFQTSFPPPS